MKNPPPATFIRKPHSSQRAKTPKDSLARRYSSAVIRMSSRLSRTARSTAVRRTPRPMMPRTPTTSCRLFSVRIRSRRTSSRLRKPSIPPSSTRSARRSRRRTTLRPPAPPPCAERASMVLSPRATAIMTSSAKRQRSSDVRNAFSQNSCYTICSTSFFLKESRCLHAYENTDRV